MTRKIQLNLDETFFMKLSNDKATVESRFSGVKISWENYIRVLFGLKNADLKIRIRSGDTWHTLDSHELYEESILGRKNK